MKNVKEIQILDKKRLLIKFKNDDEIVLRAVTEDFGYDQSICIEKDNI